MNNIVPKFSGKSRVILWLILMLTPFMVHSQTLVSSSVIYCDGDPGVSLSVESAVIGTTYSLWSGPNQWSYVLRESITADATNFDFTGTWPNNYYQLRLTATNTNLGTFVEIKRVNITDVTVTNGGIYCQGASTGPAIGISSSQSFVNYKLYRDNIFIEEKLGNSWGSGPMTFGNWQGFMNPGVYTVEAVTPQCTLDMNGNATIVVSDPQVTFTSNEAVSPNCGTVSFNSTVTGGNEPYTYIWNFGDGSTQSTEADPVHQFISYGNGTESFNVVCNIIDANSCTATINNLITVTQRPEAELTPQFGIWNFCDNNPDAVFTLTVSNTSSTTASNTGYIINWGDGTFENYTPAEFPINATKSHIYLEKGSFLLVFTVSGPDGCEDSKVYPVFNGSTPSGGITFDAGILEGCLPHTITFYLSEAAATNPPTTQYYIDFGDGNNTTFYQENMPPTNADGNFLIPHTYEISSCGQPNNSFTLTSIISNPCNNGIPNNVGGIKISRKSDSDFLRAEFPYDPIYLCKDVEKVFLSNTNEGCIIYSGQTLNVTNYYWDLFNDGTIDSEEVNPTFSFPGPGTYQVRLKTYTAEGFPGSCGADEIIRTVCVQDVPTASFYLTENSFCSDAIFSPINNSLFTPANCAWPNYIWSVNPNSGFTYIENTDETFEEPVFSFTEPGAYTLTLMASVRSGNEECGSDFSDPVNLTIKGVPEVTIDPNANFELCGGGSVEISSNELTYFANYGTISGYQWTVDPAVADFNETVPFPTIVFPDANEVYTVIVAVTNECGTTQSEIIQVSVTESIINNAISYNGNTILCDGMTIGGSIIGTIPPVLNGGDGVYEFLWLIDTGNGWQELTSTEANLIYTQTLSFGSTSFKRMVTSGLCESGSNTITFNVLPGIQGNSISADQNICYNSIPIGLTGSIPSLGNGTFTYLWQEKSVGNPLWINASGMNTGINYYPPALTQSTEFRRNVYSGNCSNISDVVVISVYNYPVINSPNTLFGCSGEPVIYIIESTVAQSTYFWSVTDNSGGLVTGYSDDNGSVIMQTLVNSGTTPQAVTYTITPVGPSPTFCIGTPFDLTVTVNPEFVSTYADMTINMGTSTMIEGNVLGGTGNLIYAWSSNPSNMINGATNISNPQTKNLTVPVTFTLTATDQQNCLFVTTITITPTGDALGVTINSDDADNQICDGSIITLTATASGGNGNDIPSNYIYTWSGIPGNATSPEPWIKSFVPLTLGVNNYSVQVNDGFNTVTSNINIIVNSNPVITSNPMQFVCSGENLTYMIETNIAQSTFSWIVTDNSAGDISGFADGSGNQILQALTNIGSVQKTITYTITPVGPSPTFCIGTPFDLTVTVNPEFVSTYADMTINMGTSTIIDGAITGGTPNYSLLWESNPVAQFIGPVNIANPQTKILNFPVDYTIVLIDQEGCSFTQTITVTPEGEPLGVTINSDDIDNQICDGSTITLTAIATGGGGNDIPANYNYNWIGLPSNATYTEPWIVSFVPVQYGTFNYQVEVNDGFTTTDTFIEMVVNQLPAITSSNLKVICSGDNLNYVPTSDVLGTTYTWTSVDNAVCIAGNLPAGDAVINDLLTNTCNQVKTIIYTIIPTGPAPTFCIGNPFTFTAAVNPVPHIGNTVNEQTILTGEYTTRVDFESDIVGINTTYEWTGVASHPALTGWVQSGTGSLEEMLISVENIPGAPDIGIVTYTVIPYIGVCPGTEFNYNFNILTIPTLFVLNVNGLNEICDDGNSCVEISLSGSQIGVNYKLFRDGIYVNGSDKLGTNNSLSWCYSNPGVYTATGTNINNNVTADMDGTAEVILHPLPILYSLSYLQPGDNCLPIIPHLSGSQTSAYYELNYEDYNGYYYPAIATLSGTGSAINFNAQTNPGIYSVLAIIDYGLISCNREMSGSLIADSIPKEFAITPQGTLCENNEELCLIASESGINYQLWLNNQPVGSVIPGDVNGGSICFGTLSDPGNYRIHAINEITGCQMFFSNQITVSPQPLKFEMSPLSGCAGSDVILNDCQSGIEYYLYFEAAAREFIELQGPITCAGGPINFGPQSDEGIYRIKAVDPFTNCSVWMDGSTTIYPNPEVFEISPQSGGCAPIEIYLENSEADATYFLYRGMINVAIITGSGGQVTFGEQSVPGTYTVKALLTHPGDLACWSDMSGVVLIYNAAEVFTLLPLGPTCPNPDVVFHLSGSRSGVNYTLWHNVSGIKETVPGTGAIVYFSPQSEPGQYWVIASTGDVCETQMDGIRTIYATPALYSITPLGQWCTDNNVEIGLSDSDIGVTYQLNRENTATNPQAERAGTGSAFSFGSFIIAGTYTVLAIDDATGCERLMDGELVLNDPPNTYNVLVNGSIPSAGWYCPPVTIGLELSQIGVVYTLHTPDGNDVVMAGTGSQIEFTGTFTFPGEYSVTAFNSVTSCISDMDGVVHLYDGPETFDLTSTTEPLFCAGDISAINLVLSYSQTAASYQLFKNDDGNPVSTVKTGTGGPLTWSAVSQYGPGAYYVKANFIDDPTCSSFMNGIIQLEEIQLPTAALSGTETICNGYCTNMEFNLTGTLPFEVIYKANNVIQDAVFFIPGNQPYLFEVCPTENTIYEIVSVQYTEFPFCVGTDINGTFEVIVEPLPTIDVGIPAPGVTCITESYTTNVTAPYSSSFSWIILVGNGSLSTTNTLNTTYTPGSGDEGTIVQLRVTAQGEGSCAIETATAIVEIMVEPIPLIGNILGGTICETGSFTSNVSIDYASGYLWEVVAGNGTVSPSGQMNTTYTAAPGDGGTTVVLRITATGSGTCLNEEVTAQIEIIVDPLPTADAGTGGLICESGSFQLNGSASNNTTVLWEVIDGVGSFDDPGNVNAVFFPGDINQTTSMQLRLTVYGTGTCSNEFDTSDVIIQVDPLPEAFAGDPGIICETQGYHLANATVYNNSSFVWSIFDGQGHFDDPTNLTPVFYPDPVDAVSQITLMLTAFGKDQCINSTDVSYVTIQIDPEPFAYAGSAGETCVSDPYLLFDSDALNSNSFLWEVVSGNGNIDFPLTLHPSYIPNVSDAGTYVTLKLTAFGNGECDLIAAYSLVNIFIQASPEADAGPNLTTCFSESVQITQAQASPDSELLWSHTGNGNLDNPTILNPTYTPGVGDEGTSVTLILTVSGNGACDSESVQSQTSIQIEALPIAFAGNSGTTCVTEAYYLDEANRQNSIDIIWSVISGNGVIVDPLYINTQYIPSPLDVGNTVTLRLAAFGVGSCASYSDFDFIDIDVIASPVASFTTTSPTCANVAVSFTDASSTQEGIIEQWVWDYGDGSAAEIIVFPDNPNPTHIYTQGGSYTVTLSVTNTNGCIGTYSSVVSITPDPIASIGYSGGLCAQSPLDFIDLSQENGGGSIISWSWDFGDGTSSTDQNPTHNYAAAGTYTVTLIVTNSNGCESTAVISISIITAILVEIDAADVSACINEPHQFTVNTDAAIYWLWDFGDGGSSSIQNPTHIYTTSGNFTVTVTGEDANGCVNSDQIIINVNPHPQAGFVSNQMACTDEIISFTDTSISPNGQIVEWVWDLGDGTVLPPITDPALRNIQYSYTLPGTYLVTLTVTDAVGCSDSYSRQVVIQNGPLANFTFDQNCYGLPVLFTDLSSTNGGSDLFSWAWDFGDPLSGINNSSTLQHPSHIFTAPGTYTVSLTVTNTQGCSSTITIDITILFTVTIDFTAAEEPYCPGELIQFTSAGVDIVDYAWDFGDGGTSVQQDPTYVYLTPGTYTVTLTVTGIDGCEGVATHDIIINEDPVAAFSTDSPVCFGSEMNFLNASTSPTGYITEWVWNFGDGSADTIITFPDNPDVSHIYTLSGTYNATLTITNTNGCTSNISHEVVVSPGPIADYIYNIGCFGTPVLFTDVSSTNSGPDLSTWLWNFGDPNSGTSNTSTLQNPTHIFTVAGPFVVLLTVENTLGCTDTISQILDVLPLPAFDFTIVNDSVCLGTAVEFAGTGDNIATWFWEFGDGGTSDQQNPNYIYPQPGQYDVTLTISDVNQCYGSISKPVFVNTPPVASFSYTNACLGDSTNFIDESTSMLGLVTAWQWDMGDGNTSTLQHPVHQYAASGDYEVQLIVTDDFGCIDTITQWVPVRTPPTAGMTFQQVCDPTGQVFFFDESSPGADGSPIATWNWLLDQGAYSNEIDPEFIYPVTDTCYLVTLTVTDANGCFNTDSVEVCLFGELAIDFTSTEVCNGQPTTFYATYTPVNDSIDSYVWNFNDGTPIESTYLDSIQHTFLNPGMFIVELTAIDTNGCSAVAYNNVLVDSLPTPRFSYQIGSCNIPAQFIDESFGGGSFIESWFWDFGDPGNAGQPNTSTNQNPTHLYGANDSTYQVKLVVTNFNGCTDSITLPVITRACLVADFTLPSTLPRCARSEVCFTDNSQFATNNGTIVLWEWNYGDGLFDSYTGYLPQSCHTYALGGTYEITLTVTGMIGADVYTDYITKTLTISATPTAQILAANNCLNDSTRFTDRSLIYGDPISSWLWDFGVTTTLLDTSSLQNPVYKYSRFDTYTTELIVVNSAGCSDTTTQNVTIFKLPIAAFSVDETCKGYYSYFTDESIADSAQITNYLWNFGDSTVISDTNYLANPIHIYDSTSWYPVTLFITDANMCYDSITRLVDIWPVPTARFTLTDDWDDIQGQVKLNNQCDGATSYFWDFADGGTSTVENPVYQYTLDSDPVYNLMLIAYNDYGCPDTLIYPYSIIFTGLYVPNAFSPSLSDPALNTFKPVAINLTSYKLDILSSTGELVFSSTLIENGKPAEGWDGKYQGQDLPTGVYVWRINAQFLDGTYWRGSDNGDGNTRQYGTVTLIR